MDSYLCTAIYIVFLFSNGNYGVFGFSRPLNGETFDFIVVGGGTGGCVVAARLAENGKHTVLLISEGGLPHPDLDIPALAPNMYLMGDPNVIKVYESVPQRSAGLAWNGTIQYFVGRALGGGSGVNGMWLNRGYPEDYNNWARITGDESWNYSNLLKYFRKYENYVGSNPTDQRGFNGPITISPSKFAPGLTEWFEAGIELGYPVNGPNDPQTESFSWIELSWKHGRRVSSFKGYIGPLLAATNAAARNSKRRSNLIILTNTIVNRIVFDGNRAIGVRFTTNSTGKAVVGYAKAGKEIIVSAGVMDSPALLMRSGVGPKSVLDKANIPVIKYLPVGKNLVDHVGIVNTVFYGNSSAAFIPERDLTPEAWSIFEQTGGGPYSSYLGTAGQAFLTSPGVSQFERYRGWGNIHVLTMNTNSTVYISSAPMQEDLQEWEVPVSWNSLLARPKSRGSVTLNFKNIDDPPVVDFRFLTHPDDVKALSWAAKMVVKICEDTAAFRRIGCRVPTTPLPACSHLKFRSDNYWECYARQLTISILHAVGTCRMGAVGDPEAVVDTQLRVIGVEGLSLADSSVAVNVINANTQGMVYVIAEKAADMILKRWES